MKIINKIIVNRNAAAWLLMATALALHVFDETVTDLLPFDNQFVIELRERLGFFPAQHIYTTELNKLRSIIFKKEAA